MKPTLNMLEKPSLGKLLVYTIPIMLTGLLQLTFNAADLIVVGQYCGSTSVAAVGATGSLTNLIINLFIGISVGSGVAVAQAYGAGNSDEIKKTVHTSIFAALISGIVLTVVGVSLSGKMLVLMGTPENELPLSSLYMKIYFSGITASMLYNFGASILRAVGDTKSPLIFLTVSGFLNVGLNVLFVRSFQMDVAGVALATVISQVLSAILVLIALMRRKDACKFRLKDMRFHKKPLEKILRIGIPSGIQGSLFSISNVLIQSTINSFGSEVLAGSSAASNMEGFVYTSMNSVYQTALNFTGQNMGARRFDNIRKIAIRCMLLVTLIGLIGGIAINAFSEQLLEIYITDSQKSIDEGVIRLQCVVLPYFLCGLMEITTGLLRGMGSSIVPMLISVMGACVFRIVWIYSVCPIYPNSPQCLYLSYPISWILTFAAQLIAYLIVLRKKKAQYELSPSV